MRAAARREDALTARGNVFPAGNGVHARTVGFVRQWLRAGLGSRNNAMQRIRSTERGFSPAIGPGAPPTRKRSLNGGG